MSEQQSFANQTFLEKESAFKPMNLLRSLKNRTARPPGTNGTFVHGAEDSTINPEKAHFFDKDKVVDTHNEKVKKEGTGGFTVDGLLGLTKRVAPKTKEPIEKGVVAVKNGTEKVDTTIGKYLAGNNPDSMRGKVFSRKVQRQVGETANPDGTTSPLLREDRQPSLIAPVENTVKFTTPFLATAYVAEKLYPKEGQQDNENTTLPKQSSDDSDLEFMSKDEIGHLDKVASLQKIAELEDGLQKYAKELEIVKMEKTAAEQKLEATIMEKEMIEKTAAERQQQLFEKVAEYDELRLRTIAQKRSKIAVDLAEEMRDCGIIKHAEVNGTIDELMECDESTIKKYKNMTKLAKKQEESLESLAVIGEYKGIKKLALPVESANLSLSKRGQTIGEAASDLIK